MYALFISNQSIYICILPRSGGKRGKRLNKKVKAQNYSAEESSESLELQSFMDIFIQMTFRDIRRLEKLIFSSNFNLPFIKESSIFTFSQAFDNLVANLPR